MNRSAALAIWGNGLAVLRARWYLRQATIIGPKVRLWGRPSIQNRGKMVIGERVRLVSTVAMLELVCGNNAQLSIGSGTFINYGCSIGATQSISIGSKCTIGTYAIIIDNNFHHLEPKRRQEMPASVPVVLEENVWLGAHVIVLPGVTIGADSVIGAGSVVTRSIPPRFAGGRCASPSHPNFVIKSPCFKSALLSQLITVYRVCDESWTPYP